MSVEIPTFSVPGQYLTPEYQTGVDGGKLKKFEAGNGVFVQKVQIKNENLNVLSATLLGKVIVDKVEEDAEVSDVSDDNDKKEKPAKAAGPEVEKYRVSVISKDSESSSVNTDSDFATNLPKDGDIVLTRVTKLSLKQAYVEILAIEGVGNVLTDSGIGSNGNATNSSNSNNSGSNIVSFSVHQGSSELGETFKGIIRSQDVRSTERDKVKIIESFKPGDIVRAQVLSLGDGKNYYLTTGRNDLGVVFAKAQNGAGGLMYPIDWQTMVCAKTGELEPRKCAKPL